MRPHFPAPAGFIQGHANCAADRAEDPEPVVVIGMLTCISQREPLLSAYAVASKAGFEFRQTNYAEFCF
jgi:hypothetical protein